MITRRDLVKWGVVAPASPACRWRREGKRSKGWTHSCSTHV
jgi:hypothetical protein